MSKLTIEIFRKRITVPGAEYLFRKSIRFIVNVLILFIIVVLGIGLVKTIYGIRSVLAAKTLGYVFNKVVTDILTFLVIIELFRSFVDFFEVHRFRLNTMIDPAIVFVIRELIIRLYEEKEIPWVSLMALGFVVLTLGIVRTLAVLYSPGSQTDGELD